jgi:hypothetical protein
VGGAVTGLGAGTLTLKNNGVDNLVITSNGAFTFATPLVPGLYGVTVFTQPTAPNQVCTVTSGSGTIVAANITTVNVNCVTTQYTVGGSVVGMLGVDSITLVNNGSSPITLNANGVFTFPAQNDGSAYTITVQTMPATTTCSVGAGTGTVSGANINAVLVTCSSLGTYTIGGTISGLAGGSVTLSLSPGAYTTVKNANGAYSFAQTLTTGVIYTVSVSVQPTGPNQTCTITGGAGTVGAVNITNVNVNCVTNTYTISGTVSGLVGGETVPIMVNNSSAAIANGPAGTFTTAAINDGSIGVPLQIVGMPSTKDCNFNSSLNKNTTVNIAGVNVTGINVTCSGLTIGVQANVTGLTANTLLGLSLVNYISGSNSYTSPISNINADGISNFALQATGTGYQVLVSTQPAGGICTVAGGTGIMGAVNVTVNISCSPTGGSPTALVFNTPTAGTASSSSSKQYHVSGLTPATTYSFNVTGLSNNVNLYVYSDAGFTTLVCSSTNAGTTNESCSWSGFTDYYITVQNIDAASANYTASVTLPPQLRTVGGTVTGFVASFSIKNLVTSETLNIVGASFSFVTQQLDNAAYSTMIMTQPVGGFCTLGAGASGVVSAASSTAINISCSVVATYAVNVAATPSIAAKTIKLSLNGAAAQTFTSAGGAFTPLLSFGTPYTVTINTQPVGGTCSISNGTGVISAAVTIGLVCTVTLAADAFEVDNTTATTNIMSANGSSQLHTIHVNGDIDYVKVNVASVPAYYIFETSDGAGGCSLDTVMTLYSTDGVTLLTSNDNKYASGTDLCSKIEYSFGTIGTYYLKINAVGVAVGTYNLSIISPMYYEPFNSTLGTFTSTDLTFGASGATVPYQKWIHNTASARLDYISNVSGGYDFIATAGPITCANTITGGHAAADADKAYTASTNTLFQTELVSQLFNTSIYTSVKVQFDVCYLDFSLNTSDKLEFQVKSSATGNLWITYKIYGDVADADVVDKNATFDISPVAAGRSDFQFRFVFSAGNATKNAWDYFAVLDSVKVFAQ